MYAVKFKKTLLSRMYRGLSHFSILVLLCGSAFGQSSVLTLSSGTALQGGGVALTLSVAATTGNEPAGIQFVLSYPAADIIAISASPGPSAIAANKSINCGMGIGSYFCSVSGLNTSSMQNGIVAVVTVTPALTVTSTVIGVVNTLGASAYGIDIPTSGVGATVGVLMATPTGLSCSPAYLPTAAQSTCVVTLSQAAAPGGAAVSLLSNSAGLTVPASVTVAAGSASATFAATAGTISSNQTATVTATLNGGSKTAPVSLVAPATVSLLACTPTSLGSGDQSTCTVTLSQAADSSGATVSLSSTTTALTVPTSVTVPPSASSAAFNAKAGTISSDQSATLSANYNSSSANTTISLAAPALASSLICTPTSLGSNSSSACTVTLTKAAPTGGASVTLIDNNTSLTVPTSVTVAAGALSTTFSATTTAISSDQSATVTATYSGSAVNATISLVAPALVSTLTCTPNSLGSNASSSCTVTLTKAAPTGGASVALTDNNPSLTVPTSVTVAAGALSATFNATTTAISNDQSATVTTTYSGSAVNATISLVAPALVSTLTCTPNSLGSNSSSSCTVTLTKAAPAGGASVMLTDNSAGLTVPASVTVAAAATSVTFSAKTGAISSNQSVTVSAAYNGSSANTSINLVAAAVIFSVACNPNSLGPNSSSTCTVTLSKAAPTGGASVTLTDNNGALFVPASVTVAAAATSATFTASVGAINSNQTVTITATYNGSSVSTSIKLTKTSRKLVTGTLATNRPAGAPVSEVEVSDLFCTPSVIDAGGRSSCELRVRPSSIPKEIRITSTSEQLKVPALVRTRAHQARLSFEVSVDPVAGQQLVTIAANAGGDPVEQTLQITPASHPVLTVPGRQVGKRGAPVRFTVAASDPSSLPVMITASDVPPGASFDAANGLFEWIPTAAQTGKHRVTFAAADTAARSSSASVMIDVTSGEPTLEAAERMCSPGAIASLRGNWLAESGLDLFDPTGTATVLGDTRVRVNGAYVPVLAVSPEEVRFLCPALNPDTQLDVVLETAMGATEPLRMVMDEASPWVFTLDASGQKQGLVSFFGTTELAMVRNFRVPAQPAQPGDEVLVWGSGFGALSELSTRTVSVKLGGVDAEVQSVRGAPGQAGVSIIQVRVPVATAFGDAVPLDIQVVSPGGKQFRSNEVTLAVESVRQ